MSVCSVVFFCPVYQKSANDVSNEGVNGLADNLTNALVSLAKDAGAEIMKHYGAEITSSFKDDCSPVTIADQAAEDLIVARLHQMMPGVACVAEERMAKGKVVDVSDGRAFFLIDPLDGTREFIAGRDEFTVNIALIEDGLPVTGVVGAPALDTVYFTLANAGAARQTGNGAPCDISCRNGDANARVAFVSRSHNDEQVNVLLDAHNVCETLPTGSSLKFCRLAEGAGDLYPRIGRTMEWDTAAGQAVLEAAGGRVLTEGGTRLRYGKPGFVNPNFVAWGQCAAP